MTSLATSPNTNENINTPAFAPDSNSSSITPGTIASPSINIPCPEDSNNDDDPSTKLTGSSSNNVSNDSTISEWLINYEGGFTKRGLIGQLSIYLSNFFTIKLREVIFILQTSPGLYLSTILYNGNVDNFTSSYIVTGKLAHSNQ